VARDHAVDRIGQAVGLRFGEEADVAEVHAEQRRARRAGELGGAEQRAVAADHDHDLGALRCPRARRHLLRAHAVDVGRLGTEDPHGHASVDEPAHHEPGAPQRFLPPGVRHDKNRPPAAPEVHHAHRLHVPFTIYPHAIRLITAATLVPP
jgi:hypothetical protein